MVLWLMELLHFQMGLLKLVKRPEAKNCSLEELVADPTFYVHMVNDKPSL